MTYYETRGPRGILEGGRAFPVYHVLAAALEFSGAEVVPSPSTEPLALDGLALRNKGRLRVLAANLSARRLAALVENLPGEISLSRLAEKGFCDATRIETRGGRLELDLPPHETVRIDAP